MGLQDEFHDSPNTTALILCFSIGYELYYETQLYGKSMKTVGSSSFIHVCIANTGRLLGD